MSLSIAEAILEAAQVLRRAAVPEPRREAGSLMAPVLDRGQTYLITHAADQITVDELTTFRDWTARRAQGEPLQYITGHQEFYGLDFEVSPAVLIPRPETELLVETAIELVGDQASSICDVGTGSGCVIISLLHELERARGLAVDVSVAALNVASRNASLNQVRERVEFVAADGFTALWRNRVRFDLIVSNPPYISDRDFPTLQREVRDHEPRLALTSGVDGLSMIKRLVSEAPAFLIDGGFLMLEIGYDQAAAVEQLIQPEVWTLLEIRKDLQGIPRTVVLQRK